MLAKQGIWFLKAQMQFIWPCVSMCVCVSVVVLVGACRVECLSLCRWNNRAGAVTPGREECCGGLNDPVSVWPPLAPILINEMHWEGKQPCYNRFGFLRRAIGWLSSRLTLLFFYLLLIFFKALLYLLFPPFCSTLFFAITTNIYTISATLGWGGSIV